MKSCKFNRSVSCSPLASSSKLVSKPSTARGSPSLPRDQLTVRASPPSTEEACSISDPECQFPDPEAKYKRYGKFFGGQKLLDMDWLKHVPRVRVRTPKEAVSSRQQEEFLELAVLNEKLAGAEPWETRKQLEYLKKRRQNWEMIYDYVTKQDAVATLALIEEASIKVEQDLSEAARENQSVSQLKDKLVDLQEQVDEAQQRLNLTQSRVEQNLKRVNELKAEAMALERMRQVSGSSGTTLLADRPTPAAAVASTPTQVPRVVNRRRDRNLKSSLDAEDSLRNFWYPAEFTSKLTKDTLVPFELFGEPWVLFRDERGAAACIKDECAHRACPLSLGKVTEGQVQCPYHGWEYNADGACTKMPSTVQCKGIAVTALPAVEKDGFVWVWPGMGMPPEVPDVTLPPPGFEIHAEIMLEVPVEHGLLMENLLDLAHAPFTHTSTFAKGWPVPDAVRFQAQKLLSGAWDPYPIDMAFQPPCMTVSTIGLAQPGKIMRGVKQQQCERHLHQLHVCMPARKGHTRLLYRMSLDFMPWIKHVPFIDDVWKGVAGQVMGEDLVLVKGQQDRLQAGADTWANPVSYDKLAVRYRRWRNELAAGEIKSDATQQVVAMDAGELFAADEGFVDESSSAN